MVAVAVEEAAHQGDNLPRMWRALADWSDALMCYRKNWQ